MSCLRGRGSWGAGVMSLPLLGGVRIGACVLSRMNPHWNKSCRTLGAGNFRVFWHDTRSRWLRVGIVGGMILAFFSHGRSGEFAAATIIVAGQHPGPHFKTLSLSISTVQLGEDAPRFRLLAVSVRLALHCGVGAVTFCCENASRNP